MASDPAPPATNLFSRRPSLFSGRHKTPKQPAAASHAYAPARTATPPQIHLELDGQPIANPARRPSHYDSPPPSRQQQPATPPRRGHASRHSISSSVAELGTSLRRSRSASLRTEGSSTTQSSHRSSHKRTPSATLALSPDKASAANAAPPPATSRPALSISTFTRSSKQKSSENVKPADKYDKSPLSAVDNPKTPFTMATAASSMPMRFPSNQKDAQQAQRQQSFGAASSSALGPAAPITAPLPNGANPHIVFQHIQELASKRISTLDYLRKAHEGRIYWFNTLLFAKNDLPRLPSFAPRNLSRRATNYLLLGFSLPTILDLNANSPTDYLKALNALLLEFEQYQQIHPPDGSTPSSLSRGRLPQMFKRPNIMSGKSRRSSSAASDFPLLTPQSSFSEQIYAAESPPADEILLPNESYTYLQTPSLPFDPDFFSTFATLCDVLIDCYTKILSLLSTPESVLVAGAGIPGAVGELFNKADARVRKIILAGVVREFEESCRQGVRGEVGGVGKVVLGGLM